MHTACERNTYVSAVRKHAPPAAFSARRRGDARPVRTVRVPQPPACPAPGLERAPAAVAAYPLWGQAAHGPPSRAGVWGPGVPPGHAERRTHRALAGGGTPEEWRLSGGDRHPLSHSSQNQNQARAWLAHHPELGTQPSQALRSSQRPVGNRGSTCFQPAASRGSQRWRDGASAGLASVGTRSM